MKMYTNNATLLQRKQHFALRKSFSIKFLLIAAHDSFIIVAFHSVAFRTNNKFSLLLRLPQSAFEVCAANKSVQTC